MNTQSVIQQKAYGTYNRNETIRELAKDGHKYSEIAKWFKLSRQAVRMIVLRGKVLPQLGEMREWD